MKETWFYTKEGPEKVQCLLCPHMCHIADGGWGVCRTRTNIKGVLYYYYYGLLIAEHVDPVEKKPLYHFLPGTLTYSIAGPGCNLQCGFCQNWQISQIDDVKRWSSLSLPQVSVDEVVSRAVRSGSKSVSYTYTEPSMFYEYMFDSAVRAKEEKLYTIMVSNGYINETPLKRLLPYIDAFNIDLKSMDESFYAKVCKAHLDPVLKTLRMIAREGKWLEVTTLLVPGLNSEPGQIKQVVDFVMNELGTEVPLHFSGFSPTYKLNRLAPTSAAILEEAYALAVKAGLKYVYTGNVRVAGGENTYCPSCKEVLIKRQGFTILENNIQKAACRFCSEKIAGVFARLAEPPGGG